MPAAPPPPIPVPPPPAVGPPADASPAPLPGSRGTERWHRLHPLSPIVRSGRAALGLLVIFASSLAPRSDEGGRYVIDLVLLGVVVVSSVVAWLVTRWRIEDGALRIETGLIRRSSKRFPLVQIQAIDTVRPFLARVLGLSELRLRMAGHAGGSGRLAYLTEHDADRVRARLLALAHGVAEDTPAPAERVLTTVETGRLLGSIVLSDVGVWTILVVAGLIVLAVLAPAAAAAAVASSFAALFGVATALWRRFNGDYALTVSEAPDGLRLRSGLLATTAETIPHGRIQAVRMIEPLLWRPFGWCRLQVSVAGRHHGEGESEADRRQLRAVLPVGTREEATRLLERIVPDRPLGRDRPPRRARWKSPLRYHSLAWARTDTCVVTTSGRVAKVTDWVPLAKVQSLRSVQGPVQRRLALSTIHVDAAGRSVHATIRDRDRDEAGRILADLIELARIARRASDGRTRA